MSIKNWLLVLVRWILLKKRILGKGYWVEKFCWGVLKRGIA